MVRVIEYVERLNLIWPPWSDVTLCCCCKIRLKCNKRMYQGIQKIIYIFLNSSLNWIAPRNVAMNQISIILMFLMNIAVKNMDKT